MLLSCGLILLAALALLARKRVINLEMNRPTASSSCQNRASIRAWLSRHLRTLNSLCNLRLSPMLKVIGFTTVASLAGMLVTMAYTGTLAARFGRVLFGEFYLAMRTAAVFLPVLSLAMDMAIARYAAIARTSDEQERVLISGLSLAWFSNFIFFLIVATFGKELARLLLGSADRVGLVYAVELVLFGQCTLAILYGYFRGIGRLISGSIWWLCLSSIGPAAIVYLAPVNLSPRRMLLFIGVSNVLALFALLPPIFRRKECHESTDAFARTSTTLLKFGFPRAPVGMVLQGLYAFGPYLASHYIGIAEAGLLLAAQIVFRIAEFGTGSFGLVILPKAALLQSEGKTEFLAERIKDVSVFSVQVGLFLSCHLILWAKPLVQIWLGDSYSGAVVLMRIMLCGIIPWMLYVMLRSMIDGIEPKPVNAVNVTLGTSTTVLCSVVALVVHLDAIGLALAIVIGQWVVGILTMVYLSRRYSTSLLELRLILTLGANAVLFLASSCVGTCLLNRLSSSLALCVGGIYEGTLFALYLFFLWKTRERWLRETLKRLYV